PAGGGAASRADRGARARQGGEGDRRPPPLPAPPHHLRWPRDARHVRGNHAPGNAGGGGRSGAHCGACGPAANPGRRPGVSRADRGRRRDRDARGLAAGRDSPGQVSVSRVRRAFRARHYRVPRARPADRRRRMGGSRTRQPRGHAVRSGGSAGGFPLIWDAVVVGAGPAGATTALLLARAGASVLLLDRARFPRDKPCSEYLSPATTDVLERLGGGILGAVERTTHARLYGMKVVAPGGAAMVDRFRGAARAFSFAVPRASFDAILLAAAARAGAEVRERVTVEDLVSDAGVVSGVVGRSGNGKRETYRGRLVGGGEGLRSVVARRL